MSVQPLPERPDLDQLRRRAKELRDGARSGDSAAIERLRRHLPRAPLTLSAAQLVISREHGFPSWPALKAEVEARGLDLGPRVDALLEASIGPGAGRARRLLAADHRIATLDVSAAAALGEAGHVRALLDADPGLAVRPDHRRGWPPLLYVCHSRWHQVDPGRAEGMLEVARLLLDAGASPDTTNGRPPRRGFQSALSGAAGSANNPAITRLLLERGADPDDDESVYHAVQHRDHECLRLLIEHGAAVDGTNALGAAIGSGDVEAVRMLLDAGADPGRTPREPAPTGLLADMSINPLPFAAARDTAAVVEALLAAGADPDAPGRDGRSPLRAAVRRGAADVAAVLLRSGAQDDAGEVDHLLGACAAADRRAAERLLGRHPGLMARLSDDDLAAIVHAAEAAGAPAVALMLDLGFPAAAHRPEDGATALHAAAYSGRTEVVRLLLDRGADVDARDLQWDSTALCWASVGSGEQAGRPGDWTGTIEALIAAGAATGGVWVEHKPPSEEVAALLVAHGIADDDEPGEPASTPDVATLDRVARLLTEALETADAERFGSLLHPDVRWGGGPAGCHSRAQVVEWYQVLHAKGLRTRVIESAVRGYQVVLGLQVHRPAAVSRPAPPPLVYQGFTVVDGLVVEIRGYEDRAAALAPGPG